MKVDAFWIPPGCPVAVEVEERRFVRDGRQVAIRWPRPTPEQVTQVAAWLRERARAVLRQRKVEAICEVLDEVAERWLDPDDPLRRRAVTTISVVTGFSEEMVGHAIDLEQVSSRKEDLLGALTEELGDPRFLDGFVRTAMGQRRAIGPELVGGVFSANIPALPHLTVLRAFLVKAACLGRVATDEPLYLPLYAESLSEVDPKLAECLAVLHWPRDDRACEAAFLGGVDHLVAYGSDATLAALRQRLPPNTGATWHGHAMGFAYVPRSAVADPLLPDRIAYDFTVFDQHACLAPQACFVEIGGELSPEHFAERLARSMAALLERLPPRALVAEEAAPLRIAREDAALMEAMGRAATRVVTGPEVLQGTVVLGPLDRFGPSPLDRFVRVVPIANVGELEHLLRPVRSFLQCAAVADPTPAVLARLADLGVNRICAPGLMGTPSMRWRHDGMTCLARLVRWCDVEERPP